MQVMSVQWISKDIDSVLYTYVFQHPAIESLYELNATLTPPGDFLPDGRTLDEKEEELMETDHGETFEERFEMLSRIRQVRADHTTAILATQHGQKDGHSRGARTSHIFRRLEQWQVKDVNVPTGRVYRALLIHDV